MPDQPRDIRAIYVSDMARASSWEDPGATELDRRAQGVLRDRKSQAGRNGRGRSGAVRQSRRRRRVCRGQWRQGRHVRGNSEAPMCWAATLPATRPNTPTCVSTDEERPMPDRNLTRRRMITIVATAAGSAFLTGGRTAQAGDAVRWQRIGTRRAGLDRDLSSGPRRGRTARRAVHPGRAAAGAAIQPVPGRLRDLQPQPQRYSGFS